MANKPFGCTTEGIQIAGNPSSLYNINLVTGELTLRGVVTPSSIYNAIGYNTIDGNIYGTSGNKLVIINNDQTVDYLPAVPNLPSQSYIAGDIDLNGRYYIYSLSEPTVIYVIDVNPASPTYLKLINPSTGLEQTTAPFGIPTTSAFYADWAFNPVDGQLYAAITNTNTVARIDPLTGAQTILNTTGLPPVVSPFPAYGAAFADVSGALYFINNNTGDVYRVVISGNNATAVLFSQAQPSFANDGARCALAAVNALSIEKSVDKTSACTGTVLNYKILIKNISLISLTGVTVTDILPDGVTFILNSLKLNGVNITGDPNNGVLIGKMSSGEQATITFQVLTDSDLPAQNPIVNIASVTFDTGAPVDSNPVETLLVKSERAQAINDLLESIALEQTALSHILNAEGEKLQKALSLSDISSAEIADINSSIQDMVDTISNLEMVLAAKAKNFENAICTDCPLD